jgi:hypothetical protein
LLLIGKGAQEPSQQEVRHYLLRHSPRAELDRTEGEIRSQQSESSLARLHRSWHVYKNEEVGGSGFTVGRESPGPIQPLKGRESAVEVEQRCQVDRPVANKVHSRMAELLDHSRVDSLRNERVNLPGISPKLRKRRVIHSKWANRDSLPFVDASKNASSAVFLRSSLEYDGAPIKTTTLPGR